MMKRYLLFLALPLMVFLSSCQQEKEEMSPTADSFQALIGTKTFSTATVNKSYAGSGNPTQLTITGNGPGGVEFIVLSIKSFDRNNPKGTYSIGTTAGSTATGAYHNHNIGVDDNAATGQIIVSEWVAGKMSGTFHFNTQAGTQITNGVFSITLP